ncbi:MAG TPA: lipoprotein, partial [Xanthobacteraceae bacterium]|nr:lipoprotein [Xanthobacteraceae bacterium]
LLRPHPEEPAKAGVSKIGRPRRTHSHAVAFRLRSAMLSVMGSIFVNRILRRTSLTALALALPLALTACGVKGPLDPPPGAKVVDAPPPTEAETRAARRDAGAQIALPTSGVDFSPQTTSSAVVNAPAGRRSSPLDRLID